MEPEVTPEAQLELLRKLVNQRLSESQAAYRGLERQLADIQKQMAAVSAATGELQVMLHHLQAPARPT